MKRFKVRIEYRQIERAIGEAETRTLRVRINAATFPVAYGKAASVAYASGMPSERIASLTVEEASL